MADTKQQTETKEPEKAGKQEMCCDGSGRTAQQHRMESSDGKCCVD